MIRGFKIEKESTFIKNDGTEAWEKATPSTIPQLEELLRKFDRIAYSKEDIKEDIIFENEVKIGQGSIRSFKDEDGDLVYTFKKDDRNVQSIIDEDFDFAPQFAPKQKENPKSEESLQTNCWSPRRASPPSKGTAIEKRVAQPQKKSNTQLEKQVKELEIERKTEKAAEKFIEPVKKIPTTKERLEELYADKNTSFRVVGKISLDDLRIRMGSNKHTAPPRIVNSKLVMPQKGAPGYLFKKRNPCLTFTKEHRALLALLKKSRQISKNRKVERSVPENLQDVSFIRKNHCKDFKRNRNPSSIEIQKLTKKFPESMSQEVVQFKLVTIATKFSDDMDFDEILNITANTKL